MVWVDGAGGLRVKYKSRLHSNSTNPTIAPVIVEATYGVNRHLPREDREKRFTSQIAAIVKRGGRCLLPVVALGRAQELLLILDEYWDRHPELSNVPIYQTSGLARRAMTIFQTYIEMMSDDIRAAFQVANPFVLKYVARWWVLRCCGGR